MVNTTMSKIIIIYLAFFLSNCNSFDSPKKIVSTYIGVYQVDLNKSVISGYQKDTMNFRNLTLAINTDGSFTFSIDLPFIRNSKGRWKIKSIDGIDFLYLVYGEGSYGVIEDEVNLTVDKNIFITNTRPKIDKQSVEKLFFNRINNRRAAE